ncbi:MAG: hypothetical protein BAA01_15095 [Bacillus thermozeamaize]|uniref:DUF2935 domain-containing protein n=1 Tax=Bacillus thermozeamaize TaxID=230954 RepID=A0A1Y3PF62_9BACI|nr:MAG: hypothetical protein BAA01_15095 [Bacillus thermozeamaize]
MSLGGYAVDDGYAKRALFEHRFWLQVFGDHARFIRDSLAPEEHVEMQRALYFIQVFDRLLERAREPLSGPALTELAQEARVYSQQLREFKLHLLRRHLAGKIRIGLPPTFLNHMLNELEEYLRILDSFIMGDEPPAFHPVHHHLLWLLDAAGHAATITCELDPAEKRLKEESQKFARKFENFYLKAVEMAGYLRTNLNHFPALSRFNRQVDLEIRLFQTFLNELAEMELDDQVLGTLSPLMADHMFREECYYLHKLAESSAAQQPDCDPTKPRLRH